MPIFFLLILFFFSGAYNKVESIQDQENWISLFNGKDLEGWDIKIADRPLNDNYKNTFLS